MNDALNAVEMVRMGYEEDTRNLHFRVGMESLEHAIKAVEVIDSYNNFEKGRVSEALNLIDGELKSQIPSLTYEIGREGSPVIYINCDYAPNINEKKNEIEKIIRLADADEVDWEGRRGNTLRAWWD